MSKDKPGNKSKFEKAAKDLGCDTSDDALDKALERINLKLNNQPEGDVKQTGAAAPSDKTKKP